MIKLLTIIIALVSVLLTFVILIQNPKGGGIDSTFGGSANQMFGAAKSTDIVEKWTWYLAIALFAFCILTTIFVGSSAVEAPLLSE
jgi:preprotein translocase subunit SecG